MGITKSFPYLGTQIARKTVNHYAPKPVQESLLSPRENEVVKEIVAGKSYQMIADNLFVLINTVRTHIKNIYKKLN